MAFVADDQAAELVDPGKGSFNNPSVFSEMGAGFDAAPSDAGDDASRAQIAAAPVIVVALIGMQFVRPFAWPSAPLPDRLQRIDRVDQSLAVMDIRAGQDEGERQAVAVNQDVAFG